jgi:hemerythrin
MISFLEGYVITHFEIEEMYMAQYNYPNHALHKEQHTQFMENLNQIKHDYKKNGESLCLALRLQQDIVDWLTEHIGKFDKDLARFMTEKG